MLGAIRGGGQDVSWPKVSLWWCVFKGGGEVLKLSLPPHPVPTLTPTQISFTLPPPPTPPPPTLVTPSTTGFIFLRLPDLTMTWCAFSGEQTSGPLGPRRRLLFPRLRENSLEPLRERDRGRVSHTGDTHLTIRLCQVGRDYYYTVSKHWIAAQLSSSLTEINLPFGSARGKKNTLRLFTVILIPNKE